MITNNARYTRAVKSTGLPWQKQHSTRQRLFTSKLDLNLRKKQVSSYIWSIALQGAEIWTLLKTDQKYFNIKVSTRCTCYRIYFI
jgi:uncharacterized protein YgiM (DUF1202 family)